MRPHPRARRVLAAVPVFLAVMVASVLFATAAGAFSSSATNTYFSIGSGSGRVCAKGIASIDVFTPQGGGTQQIDIFADNYSRKESACTTPYGIALSSFQNNASLYTGFPAVLCATTGWVQDADDGNSYSHVQLAANARSGGSCGGNFYYFVNSQHKYFYPFSWFSGSESSPAEFCNCVV